jgi:ATP-dependent Clp protease ATP-binding subunit ClpA
MAQTGEKYTEARRALLAYGDHGGASRESGASINWPGESLGWFTDQAYNAILLADDEARMLSHSSVDPEHLLLAAARYGNVKGLLAAEGIDAHEIHDVIAAIKGFGGKLELRPRRTPASEEILRGAVSVAAARGILGPSTEHLLVALAEHELPARILAELGVTSAQALVDARYPVTRPPVDHAIIARRAAQLSESGTPPPSPGPIPPIFERFTWQARAAISAGIEYARDVDDPCVEPAHLLFGVLTAQAGVVAAVHARYRWRIPPARVAQPPHQRATGIFSPSARRVVAEDVLVVAEFLGHRAVTTGHVLIAVLECADEQASEITSLLPGIREITAAITDALPGNEDT